MIGRLLILVLLTQLPIFGDAEQEVTDVVSELASALSANNPQRFLKNLDHAMPDYRKIEQDVSALAGDTLIGCAIELITTEGAPAAQTADLDWYMSLKSQQDENLIERRRVKVTIKIEKRGKKWVVTAFSPISIFAPMTAK
jgi:hypothetical protein